MGVAEGGRTDACFCHELLGHFELGEAEWFHILWRAQRLGRRQDFRRLVVAISSELERVEVLDTADLQALMAREQP